MALATTDSTLEHPDASDQSSQQQEGEEDEPLPQSASPSHQHPLSHLHPLALLPELGPNVQEISNLHYWNS